MSHCCGQHKKKKEEEIKKTGGFIKSLLNTSLKIPGIKQDQAQIEEVQKS